MTVTWPANARGPILDLALPAYASPLDCTITNVTTGERMVLNMGVWDGDDLTLDFYRRTLVDQDGNDRSALIAPLDHALWHIDPLEVGVNDLRVKLASGAAVLSDTFVQTAGPLDGKVLDTGQSWTTGDGTPSDFQVTGDGRCRRTTAGATVYARAGATNYAACRVESDVTFTTTANNGSGLLARHVDASNLLFVRLGPDVNLRLGVHRIVAGIETNMMGSNDLDLGIATEFGVPYRLITEVDAAGNISVWIYRGPVLVYNEGSGKSWSGSHSSLATGGALDDGHVGLYDLQNTAEPRYWDNFAARDLTVDGSYPGAAATLSWDEASFG